MKTVILCGGFGTRIRDVAENVPKPMIPIGPYPVLWHIMKHYARYGHKEFVLCLGYRGEVIKDFFINYKYRTQDFTMTLDCASPMTYHAASGDLDWKVTLADTGLNSLTGARVKLIQKYLTPGEDFMLTYGDGVGDVDLDALLAFHRHHGRIMTVTGVNPPGRFGELGSDSEGAVTEFNEKPQTTAGRISGGFFVCKSTLFNYLPDRPDLVFEQEPMRALVKERQMMLYEHNGFWQPMDTYREYRLLNDLYESGKAPWVNKP